MEAKCRFLDDFIRIHASSIPSEYIRIFKQWRENVNEFFDTLISKIQSQETNESDIKLLLALLCCSLRKEKFPATAENLSSLRNFLGLCGDPDTRDGESVQKILNEVLGDGAD
jgi:hypothetical protein